MTSTQRQQARDPDDGGRDTVDDRDQAAALVAQADGLVAEIVTPGRWPQRRTVERFFDGDQLQRVLLLYSEAMRLDPEEPAYPWNLASTLNRLGLNDLAVAYIERAIRSSEAVGEAEWSGAGAHLAWADMAISAGHYDTGLLALAKAKSLAGKSTSARASVRRLRDELERRSRRRGTELELAEKLRALSA